MTEYTLNRNKLNQTLTVVDPLDETGTMRGLAFAILTAYEDCEPLNNLDDVKGAIGNNVRSFIRSHNDIYSKRYAIYFTYLKKHLKDCFDVKLIL